MASDDITLVLSHPPDHHHHHLFHHHHHHSNLSFRHHPPPQPTSTNHKTTRELTSFIDHHHPHLPISSPPPYPPHAHHWDVRNGPDSSSHSGHGSDTDEDDDVDDMGDDVIREKHGDVKMSHVSSLGVKEGSVGMSGSDVRTTSGIEIHQQGQICQYQNAITVADPNGELYYSQLFNGVEGSGAGFKDMLLENGCGFSGRKSVLNSAGSGESLRIILSDPLTGTLMDDAMILPCGHSFGGGGMQHVMRMKACYTCSQPVSESSAAPNLCLRSAVHAFLREEELQSHRASKRRNKLDQDKCNYGDLAPVDQIRGRGVQFPFSVSERVLIKGNKRTPPRFVGREAIVTTQCLNGWYVVKTLDNAESVKLQYRSLAKIQNSLSSTIASTKIITPNWL